MSDSTPNNPDNGSGLHDNENMKYELITAYIDNEIKDESEKERIRNLIESDNEFRNRFIFEKLTKENLSGRIKKIETPVYVYKNIGKGIDDYVTRVAKSNGTASPSSDIFLQQINAQRSGLRKTLLYASAGFVFLILLVFGLKGILIKSPQIRDNDLVAVSRNVFDSVIAGKVKPQHQSSNPKELTDSMDKYLDFHVYIPDLKEAVLVGGVCNEINGEKLAHIIHKKGNVILYTLQASMKHVMTNKDRIILCDELKDNINSGDNWFPCENDQKRTVVIWYRDNVICATISELKPEEIKTVLTNYK